MRSLTPFGMTIAVHMNYSDLLQLVGGTQAQAREESWKKRQVEFPRFTAEEERARRNG